MFTPGINDPGPWQWFIKRTDNVGLPLMEQKRKYMYEQLLFEDYMSTINTVNTVSTAAAGAAGGPAPSTGGGGNSNFPLDNSTLSTAIALWFSDQAAAEAQYGLIGEWNTTGVTSMEDAFNFIDIGISTFNEDIGGWDVSNVTNMNSMFNGQDEFNQDLNSWDVSNVTDMTYMFSGNGGFGGAALGGKFNGNITSWDVSNVTTMSQMFQNQPFFNQDISGWDVSSVTNMQGMFTQQMFAPNTNNRAFNQPIGSWDVSNVTNMKDMFRNLNIFGTGNGISAFNQPLNNWDTSNVTNMGNMFQGDSVGDGAGNLGQSFNQPLDNWDVSNVVNISFIFTNNQAFSTTNYDALLIGWSAQTLQPNLSFEANLTQYSAGAAATARGVLTSAPNNWTITDAGQA